MQRRRRHRRRQGLPPLKHLPVKTAGPAALVFAARLLQHGYMTGSCGASPTVTRARYTVGAPFRVPQLLSRLNPSSPAFIPSSLEAHESEALFAPAAATGALGLRPHCGRGLPAVLNLLHELLLHPQPAVLGPLPALLPPVLPAIRPSRPGDSSLFLPSNIRHDAIGFCLAEHHPSSPLSTRRPPILQYAHSHADQTVPIVTGGGPRTSLDRFTSIAPPTTGWPTVVPDSVYKAVETGDLPLVPDYHVSLSPRHPSWIPQPFTRLLTVAAT